MEESVKKNQPDGNGKDFHFFVWIRVAGAIVLAVALIWGAMKLIDWIHPSGEHQLAETIHSSDADRPETTETINTMAHDEISSQTGAMNPSHGLTPSKTAVPASRAVDGGSPEATMPPGVAFVDALIASMDYELNKRLWGWRPNDIIEFTDNINQYQLGVLEVTRRAARALTENIARTGSTAAINKNLERAMNSFMIRADRWIPPSAESQYREAIANLNRYKDQLINHEESFFTRTDNLVPLLKAMEELMGSCDENLVKHYEENGDPVSTFQADNYYYYAKGVASALLPLLEAVEHDFNKVMVTRNAADIMEQAIESCGHASHLSPWLFVTEANLNGIFANHRANMAAHISHSRFYLGLMVESLSM